MQILKQENKLYCSRCKSFVKQNDLTYFYDCNCIYDTDLLDLKVELPMAWKHVKVTTYLDDNGLLKSFIDKD